MGFANFYRRFIYNYSDLTIPSTRLTRKGTPWSFSDSCRTSFETLKKAFITAPVLVQWEPGDLLIVETDTSDYALGAILSTITLYNNQVHPVAFHSQTFTSAELNYDIHDKELLAIFEAFKCWRHYLEGSPTPVDVITDHKTSATSSNNSCWGLDSVPNSGPLAIRTLLEGPSPWSSSRARFLRIGAPPLVEHRILSSWHRQQERDLPVYKAVSN